MLYRTPGSNIAGSAFGDEGMNVRIPFEVASKGVKNTDETGGKVFFFVHIVEHTKDNIPDRRKEKIEKGTLIKEKDA